MVAVDVVEDSRLEHRVVVGVPKRQLVQTDDERIRRRQPHHAVWKENQKRLRHTEDFSFAVNLNLRLVK